MPVRLSLSEKLVNMQRQKAEGWRGGHVNQRPTNHGGKIPPLQLIT